MICDSDWRIYYEAGFALGLNLPVFFTCREDCKEKVHFDIRQFNHLFWTDPACLRTRLQERIKAVLRRGPAAGHT